MTLSHPDGDVRIEETAGGRRRISVDLNPGAPRAPVTEWETAYPVDLIELVLAIKGPAYLCDEIMRDEDPRTVEATLETDLLSYVERRRFAGAAILDYGCGCGASTVVLARMFPTASLVGIDVNEPLLALARARAEFHALSRVRFDVTPDGRQLPQGIGPFDFVVLSAVYEHMYPDERAGALASLWSALKPGGTLFLDQTPFRYFPIENHTTGLPLINYLPDRAAHFVARKCSRRVRPDASWSGLLRDGIRGGTVREIVGHLRKSPAEEPILLRPSLRGCRDRIDLWHALSGGVRFRRAKLGAKAVFKLIRWTTGLVAVPNLALAIQKPEPGRMDSDRKPAMNQALPSH